MDPSPIENLTLAKRVDAELRALPLVRAPAALQARVLAELARRQALPWWRQSFRDWPMAAQWAFAVLALGLMHGVLGSLAASGALQVFQTVAGSLAVFAAVARDLLAALPPQWLLILTMTLLSSVALLLASGALVYRTLHTRS